MALHPEKNDRYTSIEIGGGLTLVIHPRVCNYRHNRTGFAILKERNVFNDKFYLP